MPKMRKKHKDYRKRHKVWQLQEAKARFSELVNEVEHGGYHTITKNGRPVAMIISKSDFEKMCAPKNTLLDFFREAPLPGLDLDIKRSKDRGKSVEL